MGGFSGCLDWFLAGFRADFAKFLAEKQSYICWVLEIYLAGFNGVQGGDFGSKKVAVGIEKKKIFK